MTDIIISVLNMSAAASVVAVAVFLARLPLRKAPKIFSYALWAVVFIRLICPVSLESPASLMPVNAEIIPHTVMAESAPRIEDDTAVAGEPIPAVSQSGENTAPQMNPAIVVNPIQIALYIGTAIWLLGIGLLLSYAVIGYIRLRRRVYDATIESGNVYRTDKIPTAFVLGLIRPRIYVPSNIRGAQLEHIIKHEQVHIMRLDYLLKPIAFLIFAVHWFNPVVWISYYLMSKDMEMSCDEAVLRMSDNDLRQDYSMSLVNLYTRKQALVSPLAFGEGSYKNMKARIKNVLNFKKAPRWAVVVCSLALVIFMVGFTTNPPQSLSSDVLIGNITNKASSLDKDTALYLGIFASSGTWSAASGIGSDTWQDQIDYEIKWINDTYAENKADFVITETLAASEVSDVSRINYLYNNSDVFRSMSAMTDGAFLIEGILTYPTGAHTADTIHRTAVMIDNDKEVILDIDYSLEAGQMAVWLVDPDGTVVYKGSENALYKGSRNVKGKKGLWSIIRVNVGGENTEFSGNSKISLRQADGNYSQPYSPANSSDSFAGYESQPFFQIISKNGQKNVISSGSFEAGTGQRLTITAESSINGGTVDLFLFSPSGKEQRFTFGGGNKTETVELSAGTWAYNCTGFYESGSITITGAASTDLVN